MIKLHLLQEIQYQKTVNFDSLEKCYEALYNGLFDMPLMGEYCLSINYSCSDIVSFSLNCCAFKEPPTPEDKEAVDNLRPLKAIENPAFVLESKDYDFEQLMYLPQPESLQASLIKYCTKSSGVINLRLLRENVVEFVAQILVSD